METFLESCILDEMPRALVKQLAKFVSAKQMEKLSFSRSDAFVNEMMEKYYVEWLAEQDVSEPNIRTNALMIPHARASAGLSLLKKGGSMENVSPSILGKWNLPSLWLLQARSKMPASQLRLLKSCFVVCLWKTTCSSWMK